MKRQWKRTLSVVLSIAMLFSMAGINTVFAEEGDVPLGLSSFCEHHIEHTENCYTDEQVCGYVVDGDEETATGSDAGHEGDCAPSPAGDDAVIRIITGFPGFDPENGEPLRTLTVMEKTTVSAIGLPETLTVTLDGAEGETSILVTWECTDDYENTDYEVYDFTPVWDVDAYALVEGVGAGSLPYITAEIAPAVNRNARTGVPTEVTTTMDCTRYMNDQSGDGWTWVQSTLTLTLTDVIVNVTSGDAIKVPAGATVVGAGEVTISATGTGTALGYGIHGMGSLTLDGTIGDITSGSAGLYTEGTGNLTIEGAVGDITGFAGIFAGGAVTIANGAAVGNITATSNVMSGACIYAGSSITIAGTVGDVTGNHFGIDADNGAVTIASSAVVGRISGGGTREGISANNITIHAPVTVIGGLRPKTPTVDAGLGAVKWSKNRDGSSPENGPIDWKYAKYVEIGQVGPTVVTTADALNAALVSADTQIISVTEDIFLTNLDDIVVGADHTVNITLNKTVTIDGTSRINVGAHTLTIAGEGKESSTLQCNANFTRFALWGNDLASKLILNDLTVNVVGGNGISTRNVELGSGTKLVLNVPDEDDLVIVNGDFDVYGEVDIQNFYSRAIAIQMGALTIKPSGTLTVGTGTQANRGIEVYSSRDLVVESGGTLTGDTGAGIYLNQSGSSGARVTGVAGKFIDQGVTLTENGQVIVAADTTPASQTSLTKGLYLWNGSAFAKGTAPTYAVTVTSGSGAGNFVAGETVTITANPPDDRKRFKEWTISPAVTFTDGTSKTNITAKFTMPAANVTVKVIFEEIPVATDAVAPVITQEPQSSTVKVGQTVTLSVAASVSDGGTLSYDWRGSSNSELGGSVMSNAATFNPSTAEVGTMYYICTITNTNNSASGSKTASVLSAQVTVTVQSGGGSSSGGGEGGGSSTPAVTTPTSHKTNAPTDAKTEISAMVDSNGNANVTVPEKSVTDAVKAAQDAAKQNGTSQNGISVTVTVKTDKEIHSIAVTLSQKVIAELVKAGVAEMHIESGTGNIRLDLVALKTIQAVGDNVIISLTKADESKLSAEAQTVIGNRPVFDISITAGGKAVTIFGSGQISIDLPYILGANENPANLFGVYVDDSGKVSWITNSAYDKDASLLRFSTNHFSLFGIGYKEIPVFMDTTDHWASEDIQFVVARELLSGTSNTTFAPEGALTHGMLVTALDRLAGITNGPSAATVSSDKTITRQELAVFMQDYIKEMGYTLPKTREVIAFSDQGAIDSLARDAVKTMQMTGIMNGKDGNCFDPTGIATRAEGAAMLYRYVKLTIDPDTAQGLTINDSGSTMMYESGKLVRSASRTVNGMTYNFDANGEARLAD